MPLAPFSPPFITITSNPPSPSSLFLLLCRLELSSMVEHEYACDATDLSLWYYDEGNKDPP